MKIGILALQGAFIEHIQMFGRIGVDAVEIRLPVQLEQVDGLVIPGGESTTMMKLMHDYGLIAPIKNMAARNIPVWGTCAGMICLAKTAVNPDSSAMQTLALMDITVRRNAFGRQVDSFEAELQISGLQGGPFHGVFIRAPYIEKAGSGVQALSALPDGEIVAARQRNLLATSFHPELSADPRIHRYFTDMALKEISKFQ
jgi:5'-phosphate synthase pdxT subunit